MRMETKSKETQKDYPENSTRFESSSRTEQKDALNSDKKECTRLHPCVEESLSAASDNEHDLLTTPDSSALTHVAATKAAKATTVDAVAKSQTTAVDETNPMAGPLKSRKNKFDHDGQRIGAIHVGPVYDESESSDSDLEESQAGESGVIPGWIDDDSGGLAVAMPVQDENANKDLPSAVECNPDHNPIKYRHLVSPIVLVLLLLALMVLGATLAFLSLSLHQAGDEDRTSTRNKKIEHQVGFVVGQQHLENATSPYAQALDWIQFVDPQQLDPNDPALMQRYIAAYFYFATSESQSWASCSPPTENQNDDCSQIIFSTIFQVPYEKPRGIRWLTDYHVCDWAGIFCDDHLQVREINLAENNMTGHFPEGVQHFEYLQVLNMVDGGLRGPLPANLFQKMKHLVMLSLYGNKFTGSIPLEWWQQARNLQRITVGQNDLTGTIPSEMAHLIDLRGLYLYENRFTGTIPTELGQLSGLSAIRIQRNQLTGLIPTEIGNLHNLLVTLWLFNNQLTGPIPTEIGQLSRLDKFLIQFNSISGDIPEELWNLSQLDSIEMNNCNLTGTLSDKIGLVSNLDTLRLSNNYLTGTIPESLAGASNELGQIWLHGNDLSGSMPESVCQLRGLRSNMRVFQLQADCLPDPGTGSVEVACDASCCTMCCDAEGERCLPMDG